tara:strand:+ start:6651 stop:7535 length:885 start_codon:yes stop_codon:yes gene_type:complete
MKKLLYKYLKKIGFKIENINKIRKKRIEYLNFFGVQKNSELLIKSYDFIFNINNTFADLKIEDFNQGLLFSFDNNKIYVETFEEILILNEIFVLNQYKHYIKHKLVLIDIGANIGVASIFFSKFKNIEKIYAYEPVEITYNQALLNFKLNKSCEKVEIKNYGLANSERKDIFDFNKNVKGNTGIRGNLSSSYAKELIKKVEVSLLSASDEIIKISQKHQNVKIFVKLDCEGGEYEIFENLVKSKCINEIDYFILEWHDKGSDIIEKLLRDNGFFFFSQNLSVNTGLIHAYRNEC